MKAYTNIEQSKKLAKILPIESADMYYFRQIDSDYFPPNVESILPIPLFKNGKEDFKYDIPCWSLAALLDVLPEYNLQRTDWGYKTEYKIVVTINDEDNYASKNYDNPLDACVDVIKSIRQRLGE